MKKVFISTAVIAVTFVVFAFAPVEKNNAVENAQTLSQFDIESEAGFCRRKYKTQRTFSMCKRKTSGPLPEMAAQSEILSDY